MAKYSGMTAIQANAKAITDKAHEQLRQIYIQKNEYFKSIEAWNLPEDSYERHMYEIFITEPDYIKFILNEEG